MRGLINRYKFLKRTFKDTLIFFEENGKLKSFYYDKELLNFLNLDSIKNIKLLQINYIIVNNMNIIKYKKFNNNRYKKYYYNYRFFKIVMYINHKLQK